MHLPFASFLKSFRKNRLKRAAARYARRPGRREASRLARALLKLNQPRAALEVTTETRRNFPDDRTVHELHETVKKAQARLLMEQAARALQAEASVENFVRAADLSRTLGDFTAAFGYAEEAHERFPEHWSTFACLGRLHYYQYSMTRDPESCRTAVEYLLRARELNPQQYGTLIMLAITALRIQDLQLAGSCIEDVLTEHPDDPRARQLRAHIERMESAPQSVEGESLGEEDSACLPDVSSSDSGALGFYLFDADGELMESTARPNNLFDFEHADGAIRSLLKTARFPVERLGIGEVSSWTAVGTSWSITLHAGEDRLLVGFFDGTVAREDVEGECQRILEGALVA